MHEVVLDPFSVVVRLALLSHKPDGTKLAICNNRLEFAHPEPKEWAWRWIMSHFYDPEAYSRSALCNLRKPVCRALRWYAAYAPTVFAHAEKGLRGLFELYAEGGNDNAVEVLRACLNIVENFAELPKLADDPEDLPRLPMLTKLREAWDLTEVEGVEALMVLLTNGENRLARHAAIRSIESYLTEKEPQLCRILTQTAI